ncbi:uncharacterized protein [Venturia canescens]|uniref:uncharacterized protein isoform X1 n=1 Tax=Venturia canescens TaxID=32260 RepID=UPI001C9D4130|nr:uncharacterized protein LOC122410628 isoform X1 [Venturia canescens]
MYYSRKLAIYNLTVFDMGNHKGTCYIWNETIAKRGANEISSCIWQYIATKVELGTKEFRFYSDNCGGQNRNQILFSMYVKAAMDFQIKITHRYLETGHTQNDGDSMHARIEIHCKNRSIYTQEEWCNLIREAKVTEPHYTVHELQQPEVFDFSKLSEKKKWTKLKISQLREINVNEKGEVHYKHGYHEELRTVSMGTANSQNTELKRAYRYKLQLDSNKKKDLQSLLDKGLIPPHCRDFYEKILS